MSLDGYGYEQIQNPLLIDLVVEEIFRNLKKDALLASRLVCKQWLQSSSKFFKQLDTTLTVLKCEDVFSFLSTFVKCTSPPRITLILNFWEIHDNDIELLFNTCSHCIKSIIITPGNRVDIVSLFSTLLRCVPDVENLTFEGLREMITNQLSRSVSSYLRMEIEVNRIKEFILWYEARSRCQSELLFSKLTQLSMMVQLEAESAETSYAFFAAILKMIPNVQSFQVSPLDMSANTTMPGLNRALQQSIPNISNLSRLRIDDLDNTGIESLIQLSSQFGLCLKQLDLYAVMHDVRESTVESLIRSQASTLEELSLGGQYCRGGNEIRLSGLSWPFCMPKLSKLNFIGGMYIGSHFEYIKTIPWANLDYSNQIPNIQNLDLMYLTQYSMDCIFPDLDGRSCSVCCNLRKIDFTGGVETIQHSKIQMLAKLFPNVTDFNATVGNPESILEVFRSWSKLECLSMHIVESISNIDTIFTGVQVNTHRKSKVDGRENEQEDEFFELQDWKKDNESSRNHPCILSLQDLTKIEIHLEFASQLWTGSMKNCISYYLSDITGMVALRSLKKLNHIVLNKTVMTKSCLRILQEELNLETCSVGDMHGKHIGFRDSAGEVDESHTNMCNTFEAASVE